MGPSRSVSNNCSLIRSWICPSCQSQAINAKRTSFSTFGNGRRRRPRALGAEIISTRRELTRQLSACSSFNAAPSRKTILPDSPARTRFAPSPTGYLHIGGLRTALFSYLLAKRTGGQFILRIEDTDQKRLVYDAESRLCGDLEWAGLQWDEGPGAEGPHGPYRQSERKPIYKEHARRLLDEQSAYRCFCTPQSSTDSQTAYVTSGCYQSCSSLSPEESQSRAEDNNESFTVRLHPPRDAHKRVYKDLVYGKIQRLKRSPTAPQTASEDDASVDASDTILMKSDGMPTYHFANVVDDHLMQITHVIRGVEWMASTPLHYDIYSVFDWAPPEFAHVPLLVDQNQAKLSKRNQDLALDVNSMRYENGILPSVLNNFLALLGWSNFTRNDVMSMDALIENFDLKFTRGNTMVRTEKLWFLQKHHVALRCQQAQDTKSFVPIKDIVSQITAEVRRQIPDPYINADLFSEIYLSNEQDEPDALAAYCTEILLADSKSYRNASHFVERNRYFFAWEHAQVPEMGDVEDEALEPDELRSQARTQLQRFHDKIVKTSKGPDGENFDLDLNSSNRGPWSVQYLERQCHAALSETVEDYAAQWSDQPENFEVRRKRFNVTLMAFLRNELAYRNPGPSISMVMALLGHEECCRRIGQ